MLKMKRIMIQLRLYFAERLLGVILAIAPKNELSGIRLIKLCGEYLRHQLQDQAIDDLERAWKWDPWGTFYAEKEKTSLLKKYMDHVRQCEGTDFTDCIRDGRGSSDVKFTDSEISEIKALARLK
jgi:hypothetical protein